MLLKQLSRYADRLPPAPPALYVEMPVRYIIHLDQDGTPLGGHPAQLTDTASGTTGRDRRGKRRAVPQIRRTSGIKPLLLADKADYTLGYRAPGAKPSRVAACHAAYLDLLRRCAEQTGLADIAAVVTFLDHDPLARLALPEDFDPGALITFKVAGRFPVDHPAVQAFWAAEHDPQTGGNPPVMQCTVCGQHRPIRPRLTGALKGIPGGQSSGTSLISANAPAFESYGQTASEGAAVCGPCGERFTRAANALLADPTSSLRLGRLVALFWTRQPGDRFDFVQLMHQPDPTHVQDLLGGSYELRTWTEHPTDQQTKRLHRGGYPYRPPADLDLDDDSGDAEWAHRFYALMLAANGGRAVIRDWIDTTIPRAQASLRRWFLGQRISSPDGTTHRYYGLYALAATTVHDLSRDLHAAVPRALLRTGLTGAPLPLDLLQRALARAHADPDHPIPRPRAALIKLVWHSHQPDDLPEDAMVQLDPDNPHPAYRSGRLLAVLEQIQRAAIPNLSATLVARFYNSASTAPVTVMPLLLRGAQAHLAKLAHDKPGLQVLLERRLQQVLGGISSNGFPGALSLEDQSLFALGFYHQRTYDQLQARQAVKARKASTQPTPTAAGQLPAVEGLDPLPLEIAEQPPTTVASEDD